MTRRRDFDVCGPLPEGLTVLEASAGTGKTFTIAGLVARYVAAGLPLDSLLVVTFTRMATGELRDRVRQRLLTAARGLAQHAGTPPPGDGAGGGPPPDPTAADTPDDALVALLAQGTPDQVAQRRRRLVAALTDFDAATIATTHSFCEQILAGLGIGSDADAGAHLIDDPRDHVREIVRDLYLRRYTLQPEGRITLDTAVAVGLAATGDPLAAIAPAEPVDDEDGVRVRLAAAARTAFEERKRRERLYTYDDVLLRLARTLAHPVTGPPARARLCERFRVVLVDEFQDTDPVQWEVLRRAFLSSEVTLVLIADPKQAIYGFRGADVHAYLEALAAAGDKQTLGVNWRSDQGLLDAYDALFGDAQLGHPDITYQRVRAADAHRRPGLEGAPVGAPLRLRLVARSREGHVILTESARLVERRSGMAHVAADLAEDVVRLLGSGATLPAGASPPAAARAPVRPRDLAVLVRTHRQAEVIRDALQAAGVAAVINGGDSVFGTTAARDWLQLLEALERPESATRARAAALTAFFGLRTEDLAAPDGTDWEAIHSRLHDWGGVLRHAGVAALFEQVSRTEGLLARVLARTDGERSVTDLRHVGELLHAEATAAGLGLSAQVAWLRRRIAEAFSDTRAEDRSRRLDSEAEAVAVLTIHRCKGLEFPVVYCPFLWIPPWAPDDRIPTFHDPDAGGRRTIDVGGGADQGHAQRAWQALTEERGEELRLAYVALTRARHQAVVWWAGGWQSGASPLGRLLLGRRPGGLVEPDVPVPDDAEVRERLERLAARCGGAISVEATAVPAGLRLAPAAHTSVVLDRRRFERTLDFTWRRTSYSGITSAAREALVASEPEDPPPGDTADDLQLAAAAGAAQEHGGGGASGPQGARASRDGTADPADPTDRAAEERRLRSCPVPLAGLPGGAAVGHLVHAVLEEADYAADDLAAQLHARLDEQQAWRRLAIGPAADVVAGLQASIETAWGPAGQRLRDVARGDRCNELDFELPLAGGDTPHATVTLSALANRLRAHLPADDPLAGYADALEGPTAWPGLVPVVRGYLAGSIDLVLRLREPSQRFLVVDFKSSWLGAQGEPLSAWHYRPDAVAAAMRHGHYPLQALFYAVALHRYLRWRLPGYRPAQHLGGVAYLFVRGMLGRDAPTVDGRPCGVFTWDPPAELITAVSDLFDQGGDR